MANSDSAINKAWHNLFHTNWFSGRQSAGFLRVSDEDCYTIHRAMLGMIVSCIDNRTTIMGDGLDQEFYNRVCSRIVIILNIGIFHLCFCLVDGCLVCS